MQSEAAVAIAAAHARGPARGVRRVLCLGAGGGPLPQLLATRFGAATVDVVDESSAMDRDVLQALGLEVASAQLGGRLAIHREPTDAFVARQVAAGVEYDVVVTHHQGLSQGLPRALRSDGFIRGVSALLRADGGVAVQAFPGGEPPPNPVEIATGMFGPGWSCTTREGVRIGRAAAYYAAAGTKVFSLATPNTDSVLLCAVRGGPLKKAAKQGGRALCAALRQAVQAAQQDEGELPLQDSAGRVSRGLSLCKV